MIEASLSSVAPVVDEVICTLGRFETFPKIEGEDPTIEKVKTMADSFKNILCVEQDFPSQWGIGGGRDFFLNAAWNLGVVRPNDWIFLIDGDEILKTTGYDFERIRNGVFDRYHSLPWFMFCEDKEGFHGWDARLEHIIGKGHWAYPEGPVEYEGSLEGVVSGGRAAECYQDPQYPKLYETVLYHYPLHKCEHRDSADKQYSEDWKRLVPQGQTMQKIMF